MEHLSAVPVLTCANVFSDSVDSVVLVLDDINCLSDEYAAISSTLCSFRKITSKFDSGVHVLYCESIPSKRLVISFTGPLDRDYDDVRRISDAANVGILESMKLGSSKPLLVLVPLKNVTKLKVTWADPKALCLTALLGALHALYVPVEVREFSAQPKISESAKSVKSRKVESLNWFTGFHKTVDHEKLVHIAWCLEEGRRVSRDIGGSDPERMCASHIVDYIKAEFAGSEVKISIGPVDTKLYPMAAIVDRGSNERHRGAIVHLDYSSPLVSDTSADVTNLFLIGKGIVYDTGGSDLKVGGNMAGMHRDKCGAAAVVGFFKSASLLAPKSLKLHGSLALVRNSIGPDAYVSDELVTSRAGVRIRVNNTDAEGRMVMTDLLCEAKEKALQVPNAHLMTIATLTGHAVLTYGPNYTAVMCNGAGRSLKADHIFQDSGTLVGEMNEISLIRREDYEAHSAREEYADLQNAARPVGGKRVRGHQSPPAFMIVASGLDSHMVNSEKPLAYTHFDIAGSQGPTPGIPTAVPLLTLASQYLLDDYWGQLPRLRF